MSKLTRWMDRALYPQFAKNWDDQRFRELLLPAIGADATVLDLGAGAGIVPQMNFRGQAGRMCGVDPDRRVTTNPYLDEGQVGYGEAIPYPDETFDLVFADNVLEHLAHPQTVFAEVARVLKPGGFFYAKTPNRRHYVPTIARLTPHWFHQWVNARRGRDSDDTFPTLYRANTPGDVQRHAQATGLCVADTWLIEGRPEYLRMSAATYFCGWLYERAVNLLPGMSAFRVIMVVALQKPFPANVAASPIQRSAA